MTMSIKEVSDRLEIEQLLVRYCYAIDEYDWDAYRAVFTQDAVIDDVTAGPGNSVEQMVAFLSAALERVVSIQHAISTTRLDIDGDTAKAKTVCHCLVVLEVGNGQTEVMFQGLWYVDDLVGPLPGGGSENGSRPATTPTTHRQASASTDAHLQAPKIGQRRSSGSWA